MNRAADSLEHHTTVQSVEVDAAINVRNRDAAVMSLDGKIRSSRHEHFEADVPVIILATLRTTREDLRAAGFDPDLLTERFRFRRSGRAGLHARANKHLVLVPALH